MIIPLSSIIIPDEAVINNLYSKGLVYYPVLKEDELTALFASLNALTGSSKVDSLNLDLTVGKLNESVNIFKQSSILRATITDKLNDVSALIDEQVALSTSITQGNTSKGPMYTAIGIAIFAVILALIISKVFSSYIENNFHYLKKS